MRITRSRATLTAVGGLATATALVLTGCAGSDPSGGKAEPAGDEPRHASHEGERHEGKDREGDTRPPERPDKHAHNDPECERHHHRETSLRALEVLELAAPRHAVPGGQMDLLRDGPLGLGHP